MPSAVVACRRALTWASSLLLGLQLQLLLLSFEPTPKLSGGGGGGGAFVLAAQVAVRCDPCPSGGGNFRYLLDDVAASRHYFCGELGTDPCTIDVPTPDGALCFDFLQVADNSTLFVYGWVFGLCAGGGEQKMVPSLGDAQSFSMYIQLIPDEECIVSDYYYRKQELNPAVANEASSTWEDCQALCEDTANCDTWTFRTAEHADNGMTCDLGAGVDTPPIVVGEEVGVLTCPEQECHDCRADPLRSVITFDDNTICFEPETSADVPRADFALASQFELEFEWSVEQLFQTNALKDLIRVCRTSASDCDDGHVLLAQDDQDVRALRLSVTHPGGSFSSCTTGVLSLANPVDVTVRVFDGMASLLVDSALECEFPTEHLAPTDDAVLRYASADRGDGEVCGLLLRNFVVDSCADAPCQNGGECYAEVFGPRCVCAPGYVGELCSEVATPTPTASPSTVSPTAVPTPTETATPTQAPTPTPTLAPTRMPTLEPTPMPTLAPTEEPTPVPTPMPTSPPTPEPTPSPTLEPTPVPTPMPTSPPMPTPTSPPTAEPTSTPMPTPTPTLMPTPMPRPVVVPPITTTVDGGCVGVDCETPAATPTPTAEGDAAATSSQILAGFDALYIVAAIAAATAALVCVSCGCESYRKRGFKRDFEAREANASVLYQVSKPKGGGGGGGGLSTNSVEGSRTVDWGVGGRVGHGVPGSNRGGGRKDSIEKSFYSTSSSVAIKQPQAQANKSDKLPSYTSDGHLSSSPRKLNLQRDKLQSANASKRSKRSAASGSGVKQKQNGSHASARQQQQQQQLHNARLSMSKSRRVAEDMHKLGAGYHFMIILVGFNILNFVTDIGFVLERVEEGRGVLASASLGVLAALFVMNAVILCWTLWPEFQRSEVNEWFFSNTIEATIVIAVGIANVEALNLLVSRSFGCLRPGSAFYAPFRNRTVNSFYWVGVAANLVQDVPFIAIQVVSLVRLGSVSSVASLAALTSIISISVAVMRRTVFLPCFTGRVVGHPPLDATHVDEAAVEDLDTIPVRNVPALTPRFGKRAGTGSATQSGDPITIIENSYAHVTDTIEKGGCSPVAESPEEATMVAAALAPAAPPQTPAGHKRKPSRLMQKFKKLMKLPTGVVLPPPPSGAGNTDSAPPPPSGPPPTRQRDLPPVYTPGKVRSALGLPTHRGGTNSPRYVGSAAYFTDLGSSISSKFHVITRRASKIPAATRTRGRQRRRRASSEVDSPPRSRTPSLSRSISSQFAPRRGTATPDAIRFNPLTGPSIRTKLQLDRGFDSMSDENKHGGGSSGVEMAPVKVDYTNEKVGHDFESDSDTKVYYACTEPYIPKVPTFDINGAEERADSAPPVLDAHRLEEELEAEINKFEPGTAAHTELINVLTNTKPVKVPPAVVVGSSGSSSSSSSTGVAEISERDRDHERDHERDLVMTSDNTRGTTSVDEFTDVDNVPRGDDNFPAVSYASGPNDDDEREDLAEVMQDTTSDDDEDLDDEERKGATAASSSGPRHWASASDEASSPEQHEKRTNRRRARPAHVHVPRARPRARSKLQLLSGGDLSDAGNTPMSEIPSPSADSPPRHRDIVSPMPRRARDHDSNERERDLSSRRRQHVHAHAQATPILAPRPSRPPQVAVHPPRGAAGAAPAMMVPQPQVLNRHHHQQQQQQHHYDRADGVLPPPSAASPDVHIVHPHPLESSLSTDAEESRRNAWQHYLSGIGILHDDPRIPGPIPEAQYPIVNRVFVPARAPAPTETQKNMHFQYGVGSVPHAYDDDPEPADLKRSRSKGTLPYTDKDKSSRSKSKKHEKHRRREDSERNRASSDDKERGKLSSTRAHDNDSVDKIDYGVRVGAAQASHLSRTISSLSDDLSDGSFVDAQIYDGEDIPVVYTSSRSSRENPENQAEYRQDTHATTNPEAEKSQSDKNVQAAAAAVATAAAADKSEPPAVSRVHSGRVRKVAAIPRRPGRSGKGGGKRWSIAERDAEKASGNTTLTSIDEDREHKEGDTWRLEQIAENKKLADMHTRDQMDTRRKRPTAVVTPERRRDDVDPARVEALSDKQRKSEPELLRGGLARSKTGAQPLLARGPKPKRASTSHPGVHKHVPRSSVPHKVLPPKKSSPQRKPIAKRIPSSRASNASSSGTSHLVKPPSSNRGTARPPSSNRNGKDAAVAPSSRNGSGGQQRSHSHMRTHQQQEQQQPAPQQQQQPPSPHQRPSPQRITTTQSLAERSIHGSITERPKPKPQRMRLRDLLQQEQQEEQQKASPSSASKSSPPPSDKKSPPAAPPAPISIPPQKDVSISASSGTGTGDGTMRVISHVGGGTGNDSDESADSMPTLGTNGNDLGYYSRFQRFLWG